MKGLFESLPDVAREKLRKREPPRTPHPMLATLTEQPLSAFSDENWIFERKLDGERCLAVRSSDELRLVSRNGESLGDTYPELEEALSDQKRDTFVVDGEVVAFSGNVTSFARLQHRMQIEDREKARKSGVRVFYYLFDLLHLEGYDTTALALRYRKSLLRQAFTFAAPLRFTAHRNAEGAAYYRQACAKGWEGLIGKDAESPYVSSRSRSWLKLKCVHQQEFVVGGYTEPSGERIGFGALLIGYYDGDDLVYAGKVGTGYDQETLEHLSRRLKSLERKSPPFAGADEEAGDEVHWVSPTLVGEVGFTEWTDDGKLRHPRFLGLRRDKEPKEVVRESGSDAA